MKYRNATDAFVGELSQVVSQGKHVTVRGMGNRELLARTVHLEFPQERFITVPGRRNDVIATIAETMWVIAGRADLAFLGRYLPRATNFSDDGLTWRGAYGPRLRNWNGVDQIREIYELLRRDPESRRAVIVLFDPARDFVNSKDIPCNNWLHFLQRDGYLDLNVVIRSNDIIWGFSGINTFEWSVLQEMMAYWLNLKIGRSTFFISSLHLYDNHIDRARSCLDGFTGYSGYEQGWEPRNFATELAKFDDVLKRWFELEERISNNLHTQSEIDAFPDPLLRDFLRAIEIKWVRQDGAAEDRLRGLIDAFGQSDVAFALREQIFRDSGSLVAEAPSNLDPDALRSAIIDLHRDKDASYGDSWKRRGELVSIMSNIARKVDRIENVLGGAPSGSEALIDTAVDLFVYTLKYETFLADQHTDIALELFGAVSGGLSDGPGGFEQLITSRSFESETSSKEIEAEYVVQAFDYLNTLVQDSSPTARQKADAAREMSDAALRLLLSLAQESPDAVDVIRKGIG